MQSQYIVAASTSYGARKQRTYKIALFELVSEWIVVAWNILSR
jgi:hypothetical protein